MPQGIWQWALRRVGVRNRVHMSMRNIGRYFFWGMLIFYELFIMMSIHKRRLYVMFISALLIGGLMVSLFHSHEAGMEAHACLLCEASVSAVCGAEPAYLYSIVLGFAGFVYLASSVFVSSKQSLYVSRGPPA